MPLAVVLFSGGLDSMLAVRILQEQGFEIEALNIRTPFECCKIPATQAAVDLGILKSDDADPVGLGDTVTYTIDVVNNGPDTANNVTVADSFTGATVTIISITPSQGVCATFPSNFGTN